MHAFSLFHSSSTQSTLELLDSKHLIPSQAQSTLKDQLTAVLLILPVQAVASPIADLLLRQTFGAAITCAVTGARLLWTLLLVRAVRTVGASVTHQVLLNALSSVLTGEVS